MPGMSPESKASKRRRWEDLTEGQGWWGTAATSMAMGYGPCGPPELRPGLFGPAQTGIWEQRSLFEKVFSWN